MLVTAELSWAGHGKFAESALKGRARQVAPTTVRAPKRKTHVRQKTFDSGGKHVDVSIAVTVTPFNSSTDAPETSEREGGRRR